MTFAKVNGRFDPFIFHDARDYVAIGCVEPAAPGKTLGFTDAAMVNVPLAMLTFYLAKKMLSMKVETG